MSEVAKWLEWALKHTGPLTGELDTVEDRAQTARNALDSLMASPWRKSSETPPPKDGSYFLCCFGKNRYTGKENVYMVSWFEDVELWKSPYLEISFPPTFWMPIPELPKENQDGTE